MGTEEEKKGAEASGTGAQGPTASAMEIKGKQGEELDVCVRWGKQSFTLHMQQSQSLSDLKREIERETRVQPKRQKLIGIKFQGVGKKKEESEVGISELGIKPGKSIMMIGSVEEVIQSHNKREDLRLSDDVIDDFDIGDGDHELIKVHLKEENLEKVKRRVEQCKIKMIGEPRENKKLLVLDIDYTLFDHRSTAERPEELRRPYLLEFLTEVYNHYDIVIWSATSMKWIEVKMKELGVTGENSTNLESNGFKILAFMDYTAMISVSTEKYGTIDCKPLGVLWQSELMQGKYGPENTIMFDDLRRNFVMNPRSGLKIRPFKQAHINRQTDKELVKLSKYLRFIRHAKDLSKLDHRRWESWMRKLKERAKSTNRHHSHSSAPQP